MFCALLLLGLSNAETVEVSSAEDLRSAIEGASAGDEIQILPGRYTFTSRVSASANGESASPIVVRATAPGQVVIEMDTVEGFHVTGSHWRFEDLWVDGVCSDDNTCEHAFHVVGQADGLQIRNTVMSNFNAQIKANGDGSDFPDDVLIEGCELYNDAPRQTGNPVTPVDVVGGSGWVVRANFIHDFAKAQGNQISYAAFLKGNGRDGRFENNLVVCEDLHAGNVRLGLSFGGGGTSPDSVCEEQDCSTEHTGGVMVNNIIAHCPADVGIYLNKSADTEILHNTVYDTLGVDVRFDVSDAWVDGNVVSGWIRTRDSAVLTEGVNLSDYGNFSGTYSDPDNLDFSVVDPTDILDAGSPDVTVDFCFNGRDGAADLGATEAGVACDTQVTHTEATGSGTGTGTGTGTGSGSGTGSGTGTGGGLGSDTGGGDAEPAPIPVGGCACSQPGTTGAGVWWSVLGFLLVLARRKSL